MRNPFSEQALETPEEAAEASHVFGCLGEETLSPDGAQTIGALMLTALSAARQTAATPRRLGIAGAALVAPLFVVSAVGAATGESPLEGPSTAIESVAASVGIGGNSGEVRQDIENRSETAGDNGQPGSQPGNTENAPGLQDPGSDELEPDAQDPASPEDTAEEDSATPDDNGDAAEDAVSPHENGKGCDDVLFGAGEPPFATPGGPAGCEVGNSADHRQNGAKEDDGDEGETTETPDDAEEDDAEDDESSGGVSHGLGRGHDEDRPGNGQANGHDKHGHEPNTNGHGPGGPSGDGASDGEDSAPEEPAAAPADVSDDSPAPGNSGKAKGKQSS